eukprot:evm.model.scf_384EXC.2 EVM.evm.TU.scf_384EXC.2   scf_384EXC:28412-30170(-)
MGAYLSQPITDKDVFQGAGAGACYAGCAMQGWRKRMEDAHVATSSESAPDVSVFGVFDGHGGCEVARFCQRHFAATLEGTEGFPDDLESALAGAFHRMDDMLRDCAHHGELASLRNSGQPGADAADRDVGGDCATGAGEATAGWEGEGGRRGRGHRVTQSAPSDAAFWQLNVVRKLMPSRAVADENAMMQDAAGCRARAVEDCREQGYEGGTGAGAAAVVAVKRGSDLFVANAGDSRGVLCRGSAAVAMTQDHKPSLKDERERIEAAGGYVSAMGTREAVNGNLGVSRAIGDLRYKSNGRLSAKEQIITAEPEVRRLALTDDDRFFVLACDGVWEVMSSQEVVDFVGRRLDEGGALDEICGEIVDSCLAGDPKATKGVGCDNMTILVVKLFCDP